MGGQSRRNDAETHGKQHQKADMRQRQITYKIEQAHNTQTCKQACRHKTSTQTEIWRVQIEEIEIEANKDVLIDRSNQRRSRRNEDLSGGGTENRELTHKQTAGGQSDQQRRRLSDEKSTTRHRRRQMASQTRKQKERKTDMGFQL